MINPIDISWLAGVFDGEGCVRVTWTKRSNRPASAAIGLSIVNTSEALLTRAAQCIQQMGVEPSLYPMKLVKLGKKPCFTLNVVRKKDVLVVAEVLEQYATAKKAELQMAIWFLRKSCRVWQYKMTDEDKQVLDSVGRLKKGELVSPEVSKILKS